MEERDPNGIAPDQVGAKLDAGKSRMSLVIHGFARALKLVGEVGTYGAEKYSPNGWELVPNGVERYCDALYRHMLDYAISESADRGSGLPHLAHAAWNALAVLELWERACEAEAEAEARPGTMNHHAQAHASRVAPGHGHWRAEIERELGPLASRLSRSEQAA